MRISLQLNYAGSITESIRELKEYEKRGLDIVWVPEAYGYDSPTLMGYIASVTEKVEIASGIIPIYSRTPALIAQTIAGLDQLSNGRAILGLGASGPQVVEGWHGVEYDRPIARTREIIEICRKIWSRETLVHDGIYKIPLSRDKGTGLGKPLKLINKPLRSEIPIFVAALGAKNVEMTFSVADGWLPIFFIPEKSEQVWGSAIKAGLSHRDSNLGSPEVVAGGMLAIGDHLEDLRDLGRGELALYIGGMGAKGRNFYFDLAVKYGYGKEAEAIQTHYLDGDKDGAMSMVPAELLELTSLIGDASYIKDRLAAYKQSGVTILNVTPVGAERPASFSKLVEIVHSLS